MKTLFFFLMNVCSQPRWTLRAFFYLSFESNFNYVEEIYADIQNNFIEAAWVKSQ